MHGSWQQHETAVQVRASATVGEICARAGALRRLSGAAWLVLSGSTKAWFVEEGSIDLFFTDLDADGGPDGRRHHVVRIGPGSLVLGFPEYLSRRTGVHLGCLALGVGDARVREVEQARLRMLATNLGAIDALHGLVDAWVARLLGALGTSGKPRDIPVVAPGRTITLAAGASVSAGPKTVWLDVEAGLVSLAGLVDLESGLRSEDARTHREAIVPKLVPVARSSWVEAKTAATVEVIDPPAYFRRDPAWRAVIELGGLALEALDRQRARELGREARDLVRAAGASDAVKREATVLLSSLGAAKTSVAPKADLRDRLLASFSVIAARCGFEVVLPARGQAEAFDLESLARAARVRTRQVTLRGAWWRDPGMTLLAFAGADRVPVALLPKGSDYELFDPSTGKTTIVDAKKAAELDVMAVAFYRPLPSGPVGLTALARFALFGSVRDVLTLVGTGLVAALLALAGPWTMGQLVDHVIPAAERSTALELGLALVVATIAAALAGFVRDVARLRIETRASSELQAAVWDRLLTLEVSFFRRYSAGDLSRRAGGVDQVRRALAGGGLAAMLSGVFSFVNLVLLLRYDLALGALAAALAGGSIVFAAIAGALTFRAARKEEHLEGRVHALLLQLFGGIAKLRVACAEHRAFARWARLFAEKQGVHVRVRTNEAAFAVVDAAYPLVATMLLFAATAGESEPTLSAGEFLGFYAAYGVFLAGLLGLVSSGFELLKVAPAYERARPLLEAAPEVAKGRAHPGELRGELQVSHVRFRYVKDGPLVLDDLDLTIRPGELVAIVGPSGAGKSSLLRLLVGFDHPEAGGVFYDGQELSGLDVSEVRQQIGVVLQHGGIMAGTIFENIAGGRFLTHAEAWDALGHAGLADDVRAMPMQLLTMLDEGAKTLSGGQRQRLLIARALVKKPKLVFFDEATSALDNRAQAIVSESLEQLQATRVVIAHRLSTVRNADRILVLDRGRLVEDGTYDELIAKDGVFAELAKRQLS
ncbi:NHLP bacteriocin export ABC transporter permease/ATPase subunit [Myxococcota bacterium]|nr:NHLP bacteriocin export ABC transporter permease/ATPase subunit [Myxococcota bacterium]